MECVLARQTKTRGETDSKASLAAGADPGMKLKPGAKSSGRRPGRGSKVDPDGAPKPKPGPAPVRTTTPPPKHAGKSPGAYPKKNLADEFAKAAKKTPDTLSASPPIKSPYTKKARVGAQAEP